MGDIKGGSVNCVESDYSNIADILAAMAVPTYVLPGDNEWTDCDDPEEAWDFWSSYFLGFENDFCGTPAVEYLPGRPANFAFVKSGVLFIGINHVGGVNQDPVEKATRLTDIANWISQELTAKSAVVRSAVIFAQASPLVEPFETLFTTAATSFGKPIAYIHGDDHVWMFDFPLAGAPNVRRIEVERGILSEPPIRVTATMDPNPVDAFVVERDPWPPGAPAFNHPPCVDAGPDFITDTGAVPILDAIASDDGVPTALLSTSWSKVTGPGAVLLGNPQALSTAVSFGAPGTYALRLSVDDGELTTTSHLHVLVRGSSGGDADSDGISDDVDDCPALANAAQADFDSDGFGDDCDPDADGDGFDAILEHGGDCADDDPAVGPNPLTPENCSDAIDNNCDGATDAADSQCGACPLGFDPDLDGLCSWEDICPDDFDPAQSDSDGDGFGDACDLCPGLATINADPDGDGLCHDNCPAIWNPGQSDGDGDGVGDACDACGVDGSGGSCAPLGDVLDASLLDPDDDGEEAVASGAVVLSSSDLELSNDAGVLQIVGLRYRNVGIPRGSVIHRAHLQFRADDLTSGPAVLMIEGEAADDSAALSTSTGDLSERVRTVAWAGWSPPDWTALGQAGPAQRSADLKDIVQELVDRPGWASGSALTLLVSALDSATNRVATSRDAAANAVTLHVEYTPTNPVVTLSAPASGSTSSEPEVVTFAGSASDPEDGDVTSSLVWESDRDGPIGTGAGFSTGLLTAGAHLVTATAWDAQGHAGSASVSITVDPNGPPVVAIASPLDGSASFESELVSFAGSALDPEEGDLSAGLSWTSSLDGSIGSGATFQTSTLSLGSHQISATRADAHGAEGLATIAITVASTVAPTVSITSPGDGSGVVQTDPVSFAGSASDPQDGDLTGSLVWNSDLDGPIGSGTGFSLSTLSVGTHTITATATDGQSNVGLASITLSVAANTAPVVTVVSPAEGSSALEASPVTFTASAVDSVDGDVTTDLLWSSSLDALIGSGGTFQRSNLSVGTHVIWAFVTDAHGGIGFATRTLTVRENELPVVTISSPAPSSTAKFGQPVTFTGGATDAEDGDLGPGLTWASDVDGAIGSGVVFQLASLSQGVHQISASASDGQGRAGVGAITLTISGCVASLDPDLDDVCTPFDNCPVTFNPGQEDQDDHGGGDACDVCPASATIDVDPDGDGICADNCPAHANPSQADLDGDGVGDVCDACQLDGSGGACAPVGTVFDAVVASDQGDAEETLSSGDVTLTSSDLDLGTSGNDLVLTAMRFPSVSILRAASIHRAWLQFQANERDSGPAVLRIEAEASDHSPPLAETVANLSSRIPTTAWAGWSPPDWNTIGAAGSDQRSSDLKAVIQEVIDRPGWTTGSALTLLIAGLDLASDRTAESFDGSPPGAPALHVEYTPVTPDVTITSPAGGSSSTETDLVVFVASATDLLDGDLRAGLAWDSDLDGPIGSGAGFSVSNLSLGVHTITATVTNAQGTPGSAAISLTVNVNTPPQVTITSPANGAISTETDPVACAATANDAEDGDIAATLTWSSDLDGPIGSGASFAASTLSLGTHLISASVTDRHGAQVEAQISVSVNPNMPPVVAISAPADGSTVSETHAVAFTATAGDDEDGDIAADLAWSSDLDGPIGSGASFAVSTLSVGTHQIAASLSDRHGAPGSASLSLVVDALPAVTILAPAEVSSTIETDPVTFTATALDAEDGDLSANLQWSSDRDGPLGSGGSFSDTSLSVGSHAITAAASDGQGGVGASGVNIVVVANTPPVVSITAPAHGSSELFGAPLTFAGSASDAEDGDLGSSLAWSSDLDGALGSGAILQHPGLLPGVHQITAGVTDRHGLPGQASIVFTISGCAPGLDPDQDDVCTPFDNCPTTFNPGQEDQDGDDGGDLCDICPESSTLDVDPDGDGICADNCPAHPNPTQDDLDGDGVGDLCDACQLDGTGGSCPPIGTVLERVIAIDDDDGEETLATGEVTLGSSDLDMINNSGDLMAVGMRFQSITIPWAATIHRAYLQLQADERDTAPTVLMIEAEASDDSPPLTETPGDLTGRARTSAWTGWSPAEWNTRGEAGPAQRSPELKSIIQELIDRPGWTSGAALTLIVSGLDLASERTAESRDGSVPGAPALHIEYTPVTPSVTIAAPAAESSVTDTDLVTFAGSASDPIDGDLTAVLVWDSDLDGPIGSGAGFALSSLSSGVHTITATVTNSQGTPGTAVVTLTVSPNTPPLVTITTPPNGATVVETDLVTLMGTANDSVDGDLSANLSWSSDLDGPIGSGASLPWTTPSLGTHTITASLTDSHGAPGSAEITLTVDPNTAPVADISSPPDGSSSTESDPITFTGSALDAEEGDVSAGLAWSSDLDGPLASGASFPWTTLSVGTHAITASFSDSHGAPGSAQITITVNANATPLVGIGSPANGSSSIETDPITFSASATDAEDGDIAASLSWTSDQDGAIGSGAAFDLTSLSVNTHVISASVTDNHGAPGSAQITVTVDANSAPVVTITAPEDDATFIEGSGVSFTGIANDGEDGDASASLVWTSNLDLTIGSGASFTTSTLSVGTHQISATAIDRHGLAGASPPITLRLPEPGSAGLWTGLAFLAALARRRARRAARVDPPLR